MSDDMNFNFKGLSDDEELDRLLESVRRDIGEASPQPQRSAPAKDSVQPAREPARAAAQPAREASPQPRRAPAARQINQARPNAARRGAEARPEQQPAQRRAVRAESERPMPPERERIRVVHPEEERERPRRGRFGLAFGIYTAVLFVLLAAACAVLWFYLDAYENTRPEHTMEEFTELANEQYWSDALEGAFTVGETPFEDRGTLLEELCMSVLRGNELVYREDEGYSADNLVYMVSAGGKDVCRVTLGEVAENGSAGFGFTYLQVTRVELLASFTAPQPHEIDITVPAGASLSVNGVAVTPDYINAEAEPELPDLPELEQSLASELYTSYHIGGLYASVEVAAADAEGNALTAAEPEGSSVTFALGEGTLDYRILVPEGSGVTVNGVELDESYNTGDTVVPAFLAGFDDYGTLPELELWLVEGLHLVPEVTVTTAEGEELDECAVDGSEWVYFGESDQSAADAHSGEASEFVTAYVEYLSGEAASDEDYTALQALVLNGSPLDAELTELQADYSANGLTVESVRVRSDSFYSVSATCCACTVDVEYSSEDEDAGSVITPYTLVMVMYGGRWYTAAVAA